ncbi:TraB/GumN family protein [Dyadobacter sp. LJ53]|uniref:TraB/GumN family protein n=1 Tax=Dyadobacter chenwenxiniae TaxID=2906456 RepID=UPI001F3B7A0C|nr:TraB/GumN family protein [Dyadobacter chenwenxiniae]MCF0050669.1 TraB/GumN family protein [Dyadobacter chenwenxiniae]
MKQLLMTGYFAIFLLPIVVLGQKNESVVWEVSGNGLSKSSYLFGTVHIASAKLLQRFPKVMNIAKSSDFGLFEKGGNVIGNVQEADIYSPPLDSIFTKSEYALVDSFFTASSYGSIKPHNNSASLVGMAQAVMMIKKEETKDQDMTFDDFLHFEMERLNKPTFQLDETGQMARQEAKADHRKVAEVIVVLIKNDLKEEEITTPDLYDPKTYHESLRNDLMIDQEATAYQKDNTMERHALWLPKIMLKMREGSCLVTVGLAHLKYKTGLIQLLREKGFVVREVEL